MTPLSPASLNDTVVTVRALPALHVQVEKTPDPLFSRNKARLEPYPTRRAYRTRRVGANGSPEAPKGSSAWANSMSVAVVQSNAVGTKVNVQTPGLVRVT